MKSTLQARGKTARSYTRLFVGILAAIFIVPAVGIGVNLFNGGADVSASTPNSSSTTSATSSPSATAEGCDAMYQQVEKTEGNHQVVEDFATRYAQATATATTLSDAQIQVVLESAGKSAQALAAYANAFGLYADTSKWSELVDGGCLSPEGIKLHNQLEGVLKGKGTDVTQAQAPEDGYNTGIENGVYGVDSNQGVGGDRTAVKFTLKDGSVVYIMVRCGNLVFPGKPSLPPVKTDNPPPTETPPTLAPKVSGEDPGPRGNAPVGSGPNQDPGPGTYVPPAEMEQPPATPYVAPAPPAPVVPTPKPPTPSNPTPAPVPTKDPAPAPAPQPSAAPTSNPVTECIPIPGIEDCS